MVWKDPPVASVTSEVYKARPLVKRGVCKTKPSRYFLQNNDPARIRSPIVLPLCNSDWQFEERGWTLPFSLEKRHYLTSGSGSFQYWNRMCAGHTACWVRGHLLSQYSESLMFFESCCLKPYLLTLVWNKPHTAGFLSVPAFLAGSEGGFRPTLR